MITVALLALTPSAFSEPSDDTTAASGVRCTVADVPLVANRAVSGAGDAATADLDLAIADFDQAIKFNPRHTAAILNRGGASRLGR